MSDHTSWLLMISIRQVVVILSGTLFAYWGYRLFSQGIQDHSGDLSVGWGKFMVKLQRAAPGTFFAIFGASLVGATAWQGTTVRERTVTSQVAAEPSRMVVNDPTPSLNFSVEDEPKHGTSTEDSDPMEDVLSTVRHQFTGNTNKGFKNIKLTIIGAGALLGKVSWGPVKSPSLHKNENLFELHGSRSEQALLLTQLISNSECQISNIVSS